MCSNTLRSLFNDVFLEMMITPLDDRRNTHQQCQAYAPENTVFRINLSQKNTKIKLLVQSLILINSLSMASSGYAAESLEQAWSQALSRNHVFLALQQKEQAANHQLSAARANYLPKISLDSGYLKTETEPAAKLNISSIPFLQGLALPFAQDSAYFGAVSVTAPIFTGGKISNGVAAAQSLSEATQANTELTRSDLKLAIAQSYINVLRAQHASTVANSYVDSVTRHVSDVRNLSDQGYVAKHDLLASEVALANAQQLQLQANNAVELANAAYNRWMGRDFVQTVDLIDLSTQETPAQPGDLVSLLQSADRQRKELQALNKQGDAYRQQAASINAGQLPQLGLNAGYGKLDNRYLAQDKGWWVGIVMSWNLFDGGLTRHQASQLSANAAAVREMEADTREKVALQVRQAWLSYQEAQARIHVAGKATAQADETLKLARERYRSGLGPNSEVLDAETRRVQAYSNRDNAIYDCEFARLQLQYAAGQL